MKPELDLATLIRQAQAGSDEAAQMLFDRCQQPLISVIRLVLRPPLRRLYDSDDFLNETFVTIFTTHFKDDVLRSPKALWSYLKKIAENRVRDANRKFLLSQRYNITRDVPLETMHPDDRDECLGAPGLSPGDGLLLKELVEERLAYLVDQLPALLQRIIRLLLDGYATGQIANCLGVERKRVYRAMDWLRKKIQE
jgi:RNA polymerase sigma factor (sigma-70 family)